MDRISVAVTWASSISALIAVLEDGTPEGKRLAREQLLHIGAQLDVAMPHFEEMRVALKWTLNELEPKVRRLYQSGVPELTRFDAAVKLISETKIEQDRQQDS